MEDELSDETPFLAGFSSDISEDVMHLADIPEEELLSLWTYHKPRWVQLPVDGRYEVPFRLTPAPREENIAASLPVELFESFLPYVCSYPKIRGRGRTLRRPTSDAHPGDSLLDVKTCSLVCRHWAKLCRQYIFSQARLVLSSVEDAELFLWQLQYPGSPLLLPMHKYIQSFCVEQTYDVSYSFCYTLALPTSSKQIQAETLLLTGPIPSHFHGRRDTPFWSFPPSFPTPRSYLSFRWIGVKDIHFPSFGHAFKYARCLLNARHLQFDRLTWDERDTRPDPPLVFPGSSNCKQLLMDLNTTSVEAAACTDNFRLCIRVVAAHPGFILHALDTKLRQRALSLVISYLGFCTVGPSTECHIFCSYIPDSLELATLNIMLRERQPDKRALRLASSRLQLTFGDDEGHVCVVGLMASIGWKEVSIKLEYWVAQMLESFPTLRVIVFEFASYEQLEPIAMAGLQSDKADILQSHDDMSFNLVCGLSHQHSFPDVVGQRSYGNDICIDIDPATISPTGKYWEHSNEVIPSLLRARQSRRESQ